MKLYVIRHGETDWNRLHLLQGIHDTDLTELGVEQAKEAAKSLKDVPLDAAFVSPLKRTRMTAAILLEGRDIPVFYDDRIAGCLFAGPFAERPRPRRDALVIFSAPGKPAESPCSFPVPPPPLPRGPPARRP